MLRATSNIKNKQRGFTLIELLLVIAITLTLSAAAAAPIYGNLQGSVQLQEATTQTIQLLRMARERSVAGVNNLPHGIYFDNVTKPNVVVLFQGGNYTTRDQSLDRTIEIPATVSLSTTFGNEAVFALDTGLPNASGTITLTHDFLGEDTVSLNTLGVVGQE